MNLNAYRAASITVGSHRVMATHGPTCYHPETMTVNISTEIVFCHKLDSILDALHECGHSQQHRNHPVLFGLRHLWPVRLWLERDAWRKAHAYARILGFNKALEGRKAVSHPSYWKPRIFMH
jgi:hypothetical protein